MLKLTSFSYAFDTNNKNHYLNEKRKAWNHPVDKDEVHNCSFFELYNRALDEAVNIIETVNKFLYKNKKIDLLDKVFLNLSYLNGKDSTLNLRMKYFEF